MFRHFIMKFNSSSFYTQGDISVHTNKKTDDTVQEYILLVESVMPFYCCHKVIILV